MNKCAIIIGAGPAGLTAAYELITKTDIKPIIIEKTDYIGGISRTVVHNGNRMDIGGHRFFSKSDTVMKWWQDILPLQKKTSWNGKQKTACSNNVTDPEKTDRVMLVRNRLSRIFYLGKFFDYPIRLNWKTVSNLGMIRITKIGWAYFRAKILPARQIHSLEDFFISRFGQELYETFFKDYTQKIWGVSCKEIAADWGAQRIKELSVFRTLLHAIKSIIKKDRSIHQKKTDTSLIKHFMYPKLGPGQMWETVARMVEEKGGVIIKNAEVTGLKTSAHRVTELTYYNQLTDTEEVLKGDYYFSTMPVKDLISAIGQPVPAEVKEVSDGLPCRDSITVGLLLHKLMIKNETKIPTVNQMIPDNWIYIQERDVKLARMQIFNNWSPYLVADSNKVWIGLEYCCAEGDDLWKMRDADVIQFTMNELSHIGVIDKQDVVDGIVIRTPKTYPGYFGTYPRFGLVRDFTDRFENLFLIGRNGMHKYYNQDHAMLTAMAAVNNIMTGDPSKDNIWNINMDDEYIETEND
jgi:protoporphyrinogen oxidase